MVLRESRREGFTLIELMVVVSIIGVLAAIAIPAFTSQQNTAKRAEAYSNLASLGKAEKAYYAEYGKFEFAVAEPSGVTGKAPGTTKRSFSGVTAFDLVGWLPDGAVYFDYDANTPAGPGGSECTCTAGCFTAAAYGDLDGKNGMSVMVYAHPDAAGNFCGDAVFGNAPPGAGENRRFGEVVRVVNADLF